MKSKGLKINKAIVFFLFLFCYIAFPVFGEEQDSKKQLSIKIRRTVEAIHAVRMKRLRMQEQYQARIDEIQKQIKRLEADLKDTITDVHNEKACVDKLSAGIKRFKEFNKAVTYLLTKTTNMILPVLKRMQYRVAAGIPYHRDERLARVESIIEDVSNADIMTKGEGLKNFWLFVSEELQLAKSIKLWNEPVFLEGGKRRKHAYQVRLGLVNQFFIAEDAVSIGLASKDAAGGWNMGLGELYCGKLRNALQILQQRRPPELISIPFTVMSSQDSKKAED